VALQGEYEPGTWPGAARQVAGYEASGGATHNTAGGKPVIILHTRGRRTGKIRKAPLIRVEHDGAYLAVASKGGADDHPEWYLNLLADAQVALQDGAETVDMTARVLAGAERVEWWARAVETFPLYAKYERQSKREIPIVLVSRE